MKLFIKNKTKQYFNIVLINILIFTTIFANYLYVKAVTVPSEYEIVISPQGGEEFEVISDNNHKDYQSYGRVWLYEWGTPATITLTANPGYEFYPLDDKIQEFYTEVSWCSANADRQNANGLPVNTGVYGKLSEGWKTYTITISADAFKESNGSTIGYSPACTNLSTMNFNIGVRPSGENGNTNDSSNTNSETPENSDTSNNNPSINMGSYNVVTPYEAESEDEKNEKWEAVTTQIRRFEDIIELITNFIFGAGIITSFLCIIISLYKYAASSTHPRLRRDAIINVGVCAICIAMLGSIKLLVTLILQIAL